MYHDECRAGTEVSARTTTVFRYGADEGAFLWERLPPNNENFSLTPNILHDSGRNHLSLSACLIVIEVSLALRGKDADSLDRERVGA